jgi:putative Mg2+ transporter-C (MgtC) family protein
MTAFDPTFAVGDSFQWEWVVRLLAAIACGALIGIDREMKDRPAGLRTHALVSMSAAAFTILCGNLFGRVHQFEDVTEPDFLRIIEGVIAGVAFLGAGSIIHGRRNVAGLTTGAGIWAAGAAGLACGAQLYGLAVVISVLAFALLALAALVERVIPKKKTPDRPVEG